jgi:hypothetical protein
MKRKEKYYIIYEKERDEKERKIIIEPCLSII